MIKIKNNKEYAFRFTGVLAFMPGETTIVPESVLTDYPSIKILIERGDLEIVKAKKSKEAKEEVIEEV